MPYHNLTFSRQLLKEGHALVKKHFPRINVVKDAWTMRLDHFSSQWEFRGPDKFYWHGKADNAYDCRYKGWMAYLQSKGKENA